MKSVALISALVVLSLVGCSKRQVSDIRSGTLTVLATESLLPLAQSLASDYQSMFPAVVVTVRGATTRGAIVDMVNDSAHCVIVDRPLNQEERSVVQRIQLRLVETEIAHDGLAVIVHPQNKLPVVSMDTLRSILSGQIAVWGKLPGSRLNGAIELCLTGRNSGVYELVARNFFQLDKDVPLAAIAQSQQQVIEFVAAHPEALGIVSFATWKDTSRSADQSWKTGVRMLELRGKDADGVEVAVRLNQRNIYDKLYPLTYSLYVYTSEKTPGTAQGFSAFVAGEYGQRTFLYAGLVPETMPYRSIQLTQE